MSRITNNKTKTNGMSYDEMVANAIERTTLKREHVTPSHKENEIEVSAFATQLLEAVESWKRTGSHD